MPILRLLAAVSILGALSPQPVQQTFNRQLRTANGTLPARLKLRWKYKTGGPVVSSAAVSGDRLFIGSGDKNVYALSLRDGKKLWAYTTKDTVDATPLVVGSSVVS